MHECVGMCCMCEHERERQETDRQRQRPRDRERERQTDREKNVEKEGRGEGASKQEMGRESEWSRTAWESTISAKKLNRPLFQPQNFHLQK